MAEIDLCWESIDGFGIFFGAIDGKQTKQALDALGILCKTHRR